MSRATRDTPPQSRAKKLITMRLQKKLIADLKELAKLKGIRYQTLVNRVLAQWVEGRGVEP